VVAITVRDDVECKRVVKNMIVKSKVAAIDDDGKQNISDGRGCDEKGSPWDVANASLLEGGPVGFFDGRCGLGQVFGRNLACPVGLDGFFDFAIGT
jgi:hypothetical protein